MGSAHTPVVKGEQFKKGAASIREGAYIDVRNRADTELQRRNAKYVRRLQNGGDASETRRGEYPRGRVH